MISGLKIGNFKAFGPSQEIPLRKLTLVFGPNSAGKSSIIQSLLLARHIQDTGNVDAHQTTLGGATVDLGGFSRYVHKHESNRDVDIRFRFERCDIGGRFLSFENFETLTVAYTIGRGLVDCLTRVSALPQITSVVICLDGRETVRLIVREDGRFQVAVRAMLRNMEDMLGSLMDEERHGFSWILERQFSDVWKFRLHGLSLLDNDPLPRPKCDRDKKAPLDDLDGRKRELFKFFYEWDLDCSWDVNDRNPLEAETRALVLAYDLECLVGAVNDAIRQRLETVSYLGPLRWIPPRFIPEGEQFDASWKAGGGDAWQRLRREPELLDRVNHFLQDTLRSRYRLECQHFALVKSGAVSDTGSRVAEEPPSTAKQHAQNADETLTTLSIVDADTGLRVSHRDVGTGISQLLPVLVNAAGAREGLIAIEQPELHLHPALQAELGDVFIKSALGGNKNTFLIETHSEHLLLRIMRRIRQTTQGTLPEGAKPITPNDVALLYVSPSAQGSIVQDIGLNDRGELVKGWPGGFFEEGFDEMFG